MKSIFHFIFQIPRRVVLNLTNSASACHWRYNCGGISDGAQEPLYHSYCLSHAAGVVLGAEGDIAITSGS